MKLVAVDLFCGAGGLSLGLEQAGFVVPVGYDIDPVCKPAFEQKGKRRFECQDISTLSAELVAKEFKGADVRLLAGCAPCQTFSTYSRGSRLAPSDDKRWSLIDHFGRIVKDVLPEFVTMENVPRAALYKSYNDFVLLLESLKYNVYHEVVDCSEIGLPQQRKRRVLIASRVSETPIVSKKEKKRTVRDAIYHLPKLEAGESSKEDRYHIARRLNELNLKRVKATPPGGGWPDWPEELRLACHKKSTGRTYRSIYGRMKWDEPAPTLTTLCNGIGNGRYVHPEQHRGITLREAAILQGFPDEYLFDEGIGPVFTGKVSRLIGNAVPPLLGKAIGEAILNLCR